MMLNVHKNHKGRGDGGRGVEMGEREITDIYRNTVTTRMAPALRWAAMSHFNVSFIHCEGQCHKPDSATNHNFWRERRAEADSNRGPFTYQPAALPLGQTGSLLWQSVSRLFIGCCKLQTRGSRHPSSDERSRKCEDTVQLTCCLKSSFSGTTSVVQQSSQKRHLAAQLNLFFCLFVCLFVCFEIVLGRILHQKLMRNVFWQWKS